MNGLELSKQYYKEYGEKMLLESFSDLMPHIAVGLCGSGSECFGYDDEVSTDHDFEPGFIIFLPDENTVDRKAEFNLERAYAKLPKDFMGFSRQRVSPVGGNRHGVIRQSSFFADKCGSGDGILTLSQWLTVPEYSLAEAVNGELFHDGSGEVTDIRRKLSFYPHDIFLKKLAGELLIMAQSGQYNYMRCLEHGESGAAQLAVYDFVKSGMKTVFLLNGRYMPYYKWSFKAMRSLPKLSSLADTFEYLISSDNGKNESHTKINVIEDTCGMIIDELKAYGYTKAVCGDMEKHAYSVNDCIEDSEIRNIHILAGIN